MDRKLWNEPFDERALLEGAALARGSLLAIHGGRGALVFVERGRVWLTQENDSRDVVLSAGTWFRLDRDGAAIVEAHSPASLTLTAAAEAPLPEIRMLPRDAGADRVAPRRAGRRGPPFLRALTAWWLRLYRRAGPSVLRRYAGLL
jgi:hypothetical protein